MTTPTTPTGKRLYAWLVAGNELGMVNRDPSAILAIEQEARAMERERLQEEVVATFGNANDSELMRWVRWTLFADPEPDR